MKKIAIGCDHAAFGMKEKIKIWIVEEFNFEIKDFGTYSEDSVDYPDFIHPTSASVENKEVDFGIVMCGSGNGAAITSNKHKGIRAALCWNEEISALAKQHNNANIISIPARFIDLETAQKIIRTYINAKFEGGRHKIRINKI